jgi:hypothetical protein
MDITVKQNLEYNFELVKMPELYDGFLVHKYMTSRSITSQFQYEMEAYAQLIVSPYIPDLVAIVRQGGLNRGFLRTDIDGLILGYRRERNLTTTEKWDVTKNLLQMLADFDDRGYFPTNLNPAVLVYRTAEKALTMVDLAYGTFWGTYFRERTKRSPDGRVRTLLPPSGVFSGVDSLYCIGRNVRDLWLDLEEDVDDLGDEDIPENFPAIIRALLVDCFLEESKFEEYKAFHDTYFDSIVEGAACN